MKKLLFYLTWMMGLFLFVNFSFGQGDSKGLNVPYTQSFENGEDWSNWLIINVNDDTGLWSRQTSGGITGSPCCMRYNPNTTLAADDWLLTPKFNLVAGTQYSVRFYIRGNNTARIEKLSCYAGNDQTIAAMTTLIWEDLNINYTVHQCKNVSFTPATTGEYVFGFWAHSDANQNYLVFDEFSINLGGTITGIVTDGDGNPVEGATVQTVGSNPDFSTTTDATGAYLFAGFHAGTYNLSVTRSGYHGTAANNVSVSVNTVTTQNFVIIEKQPETVPYTMGFENGLY